MALAVVVLLVASYISSWFFVNWLVGRRTITMPASATLRETVFAPVAAYIVGELPGHEILWRATLWCQLKGAGADISWEEVQSFPKREQR